MGARRAISIVSLAIAATACSKGDPGAGVVVGSGGAPAPGGVAGAPGSGGATGSGDALGGSGGAPAASGGTPGAPGGTAGAGGVGNVGASAGAAGGGVGGSGLGGQGAVAPGTCGVSHMISVPVLTNQARYQSQIRRQASGFVVGPWRSLIVNDGSATFVNWQRVDASDAVTTYSSTMFSASDADEILNVGAANQLAYVDPGAFGGTYFESQLFTVQDGTPSAPRSTMLFYLSDYSTRTAFQFLGQALDGQHWLYVTGPNFGSEIDTVVIGPDGSAVAPYKSVSTPGGWACGSVQPTADAGVVSVVEATAAGESFHLLELSATGDITWQTSVPVNRDRPPGWGASALPCPEVALSQGGLAFVAYEVGASASGWHLHQVGRDGSATDETWDALSPSTTPRGLAIRDQVAMVIALHADDSVGVVKRTSGHDEEVALPLAQSITPTGMDGPIASEAGRLFLDVSPVYGSSTPSQRWIVEVDCP